MSMQSQFGFDINNPGASGAGRGSVEIPSAYFDAVIADIIINENNGKILRYKTDGSNIGEALVRIIPDDWGIPETELKSAFPLEMNIQEFPVVGEQVILFKAFGTLFYTRKISTKRKLTENVSQVISQTFSPISTGVKEARNSRQLSAQGVPVNLTSITENRTSQAMPINSNVRPLRSNIGDVIISGRFGNFIRMGSSLFTDPTTTLPQPNILLTAGAWETPKQVSTGNNITPYSLSYENINNDKTSIWMVADQEVKFQPITAKQNSPAHLLSSEQRTAKYTGAQIFISSDRVILNSKNNEISLFANKEINLSSIGSITLDTQKNIFLRSFAEIKFKANGKISLDADEISIIGNKKLIYNTSGDYGISGKRIFIGNYGDTTQPMVLGSNLALWLNALLIQLLAPGTFISPIGPVFINPVVLQILKEMQSNLTVPANAYFNSKANYVSETNS